MSIFAGRLYTITADCGHEAWKKGEVTAFGTSRTLWLPIRNGSTPYCHACLAKMTIRCAWCGEPIFIHDPVTLFSRTNEDSEIPDHAVRYPDNRFVGCLNCASFGIADCTGFWMPPGQIMPATVEDMVSAGHATVTCFRGSPRAGEEVVHGRDCGHRSA